MAKWDYRDHPDIRAEWERERRREWRREWFAACLAAIFLVLWLAWGDASPGELGAMIGTVIAWGAPIVGAVWLYRWIDRHIS